MTRSRRHIALAAVGIAVLAIVASLLTLPASAAVASSASLNASKTNLALGDVVAIDVFAANLENIAAYDVKIEYDASVLEFVEFTNSEFLASTGRSASCPPAHLETDPTTTVQAGCGTLGLEPPGPSGDAVLGTFKFKAIGEGKSDLVFRKIELALPSGDSCCDVLAVHEVAVVVGSGAVSGNPTQPPTPKPDLRRLTPTVPAGAAQQDTYRLDPAASAAALENATPSAGAFGGRLGSGDSSSNGQSGVSGSSSDFPVAGHGPQDHQGGHGAAWSALFSIFIAGAFCVVLGLATRIRMTDKAQ